MARQVRGGLAGVPCLLTQRVQQDQLLVRDDLDRLRLLDTMRMASQDHKVAVHAYAVSEGGWWMLATPATPDGLSLMVQSVGRQYVGYYNRRHGRHGSLWASRYKSCVLASAQDLLDAVVLIESSNPSGAWSSAAHHLGRTVDPLVSDHAQFWTLGNTPFEREAAWRRRLEEGLSAARQGQLVKAASKGWALGAEEDIQRLQQQTERRLTPGKRGRPSRSAGR
ncbi:MAG: transposase [Burkholderiales bacterium]|nr:transposase [Burkholderiales bacterium]